MTTVFDEQQVPEQHGGGGSGVFGIGLEIYDLTAQMDGVKQTFAIDAEITSGCALFLFYGGQYQSEGKHYSVDFTNHTITTLFEVAPTSADNRTMELKVLSAAGVANIKLNKYDLTEQMDGAKQTFAIDGQVISILFLFYGGQHQTEGVNYTVDYVNHTLTTLFEVAPSAADNRTLEIATVNIVSSSPELQNQTSHEHEISEVSGLGNILSIMQSTIEGVSIGSSNLPSIRQATAPIMLAATNGAAVLTGNAPVLTRIGNMVTMVYQGANKSSNTATTISLAHIPEGYRPAANVSQSITTPAVTITVQVYTSGTNVFPDAPGTNVTSGNTKWTVRASAQLTSGAAVSINLSWMTSDAMPIN